MWRQERHFINHRTVSKKTGMVDIIGSVLLCRCGSQQLNREP